MKVVVDVNFPPSLVTALSTADVEGVHWTTQGEATAPDAEILAWARRWSNSSWQRSIRVQKPSRAVQSLSWMPAVDAFEFFPSSNEGACRT